jgi:type I restriction enzyme R subunit
MDRIHTEKTFESAIQDALIERGGYVSGQPKEYDSTLALFPNTLWDFLVDSQPEAIAKLEAIYGEETKTRVLKYIASELNQRGSLEVLRKGLTDRGVSLSLAYFRAANELNEELNELYEKNVLTITRQVHFSLKNPDLSIDCVISLNGIPVATCELKQPFTNQNFEDAIKQYRYDRDPTEPLLKFKQRTIVHFAVDPDVIYMATKLSGKDTTFLPFNKGVDNGAGNPSNPTGFKTDYLWEEILPKDSWLDIIARYCHVQVDKDKITGKVKEKLIFPRYHQLDAVRKLTQHAASHGTGKNYLVQHSAGSGKSNSIAWLSYRLASLHNTENINVFDSVIVVTDRRVLDSQLQNTIYQFDHKQGVVWLVRDDAPESKGEQLANALNASAKIIIVTLQSFSFILDKLGAIQDRKYAVVVDEAHSSQTGESAATMRKILATTQAEDAEDDEESYQDEINKAISARGPQTNISFFAFTATPKYKTLSLFGTPGPDGKPQPFHLYSMKQAIEEGFILDVLKNYTTYKTYFKLSKSLEEDPEVDKAKAARAIARFVSLHPHNLAQKTEIMVEHFRQFTRFKIEGKAKAMVVTASRQHAVRYKQEFDRYISEKGYDDLKALVAFSGKVNIDGLSYTESQMNGFGERELPDRFETDEYQVLLVAEKYQTGFDQPLLHTMYVDKKLQGLQAVQTLSRLNRTRPGKMDTFVLDFVNTAEEIQEAFAPFYEVTKIDEVLEPNQLYTLKNKLDGAQIYWEQDVENFARVFFKPLSKQKPSDQGLLHACIDPALERFKKLSQEEKDLFQHDLATFIRFYSFVSQMINLGDASLEKLYAYGRLLLTKLPKREDGGTLELDGGVSLSYYRIDKTFEGSNEIADGSAELKGPNALGTGKELGTKAPLSQIIGILNEKFGTDFTSEDQLLFDRVVGDLSEDDQLSEQARNNSIEQFKYAFEPKAVEAFLNRMERNEDISTKFMQNKELRETALEWMMEEVFKAAHGSTNGNPDKE